MFVRIGGHRFLTISHGSAPRTFLAHSGWVGTNEDWLPTLLIHGEKDAFVSLEAMEHLAARIPGSRLAVIPGAGHLPAMIQPERVASLINEHFAVQSIAK
jgi:pimeloyl-ACP methyl ester carboxylesterase